MRKPFSPLSWQIRAELFAQLAAMEKAGLPTAQAFGLLKMPEPAQTRLLAARKLLVRGTPIAASGRNSGLFSELETNLIDAATNAGSPAQTYRRLADYYTRRAVQLKAMRSKMVYPAVLLITSLFLNPLPAFVAGNMSLARYLIHGLTPLIAIGLLIYLIVGLLKHQEGPPSELHSAANNLAMQMPLFGKMLIRSNIRDYFESLALMVEAGVPILDALPKALATMRLIAVKQAFENIPVEIQSGRTLAEALEGNPYLKDGRALALIHTGEGSGTLPEMLFRFADSETQSINHFNEQAATWLPRIVYAFVAAWVAYGILSSPGVGTELPPELR